MGFMGTCKPWTPVTSDPATQVAPTVPSQDGEKHDERKDA